MVSISGPIVAFALVTSVFTAVVFGLIPALRVSGEDAGVRLQEGGRGRTAGRGHMRTQHSLVVAEVAVSVLLVTGAGLLLKSYVKLSNVDAGFATENLLTFRLNPSRQRYQSHDEFTRYYEALDRNLTALPGVASAGAVSALPLTGAWDGENVLRPDRPRPDPANNPHVEARAVTPDYFNTLGIGLLRGRLFTAADNEFAPDVAVISGRLARRLFPGEDPIGKYVTVSNQRPCEIVGIVADVNNFGLEATIEPTVYAPHAQRFLPWIRRTMAIALKTSLDQVALIDQVRRAVRDVDPTVAIADFRTMDRIIADDIAGPRLRMSLLTSFAMLAILLALIGVSSVMAYAVSQRRSEIGTRLALGATEHDVVGMVIKDGTRPVLLGLCLGVFGALFIGRAIRSMLFLVEPRDPAVLLLVTALLASVALIAMWVPAVRASRVAPVDVLKQL
jgi:putative ABC transport system permease protein